MCFSQEEGSPNQTLEQTRDSVLRYGEGAGRELLNFGVRWLMNRPPSDRAIDVIARYGGLGVMFLALSFLPVGSDYRSLLQRVTLPGALLFLCIAAGLGVFGVARYPSRSMTAATVIAVCAAVFSAFRFWQFANAT